MLEVGRCIDLLNAAIQPSISNLRIRRVDHVQVTILTHTLDDWRTSGHLPAGTGVLDLGPRHRAGAGGQPAPAAGQPAGRDSRDPEGAGGRSCNRTWLELNVVCKLHRVRTASIALQKNAFLHPPCGTVHIRQTS